MPTERINEATRFEWRELGFYYDQDQGGKSWCLVGSRSGLRKFAKLQREYADDLARSSASEHEHYGPYMYLKVMTLHSSGTDENSIHGTNR